MRVGRRDILRAGGGIVALLAAATRPAGAAGVVDIAMGGRSDGGHVWFDPLGLLVAPGQTVRWTNRDAGNAHTATAYHPAIGDRPPRIPAGARPWDSDYLLPGESFSVRLTVPGVYDYYCVPHEQAGMVGRIVVGDAGADRRAAETAAGDLPDAALRAFPPVAAILRHGIVRGS